MALITVETIVHAPVDQVWRAYTSPDAIVQWNAASDDWHTTKATVDLRPGGAFCSRMEAKDGSFGFDFAGTYTQVVPNCLLEYAFGERTARVEFVDGQGGVTVRVSFDAEETHSLEQQRGGWQAILDRFRRYVETSHAGTLPAEPPAARSDARQTFIPAAPAEVYAAMADPARLGRWWGPDGFTNTIHQFDFEPGGRWTLTMHGPDGKSYPNESRFARLIPNERFEIEHLTGHHFVLTIELRAVEGGTEVRWTQTFDTVKHYASLAAFVASANEQNLQRLKAEVARLRGA